MIFLDTSAIYALADRDDQNNRTARNAFEAALAGGEVFLLHSYILVESAALLQRRLGHSVALKFLKEASNFRIVWVDKQLHDRAVREFEKQAGRRVSLVDLVSFLVMKEKRVDRFLAFDVDFDREGFTPFKA